MGDHGDGAEGKFLQLPTAVDEVGVQPAQEVGKHRAQPRRLDYTDVVPHDRDEDNHHLDNALRGGIPRDADAGGGAHQTLVPGRGAALNHEARQNTKEYR